MALPILLASPVGGSPDDDYHLASIWCPRPVEGSCWTRIIDGEVNVLVPEPIAKASTCYAFKQEVSAACTLPYLNENDGYTRRYDDGNYPKGYYRFHHLFISESVNQSADVYNRTLKELRKMESENNSTQ